MTFAFWLLVMSALLFVSVVLLSLFGDIVGIYLDSAGQVPYCPPTDKDELKKLLGSAYNARYMSIERPRDFLLFTPEFAELDQLGGGGDLGWELADETDRKSGPRDFDRPPTDDFAVQPDFSRLLVKKQGGQAKRPRKFGRKSSRNQTAERQLEAELTRLANDSDDSSRAKRAALKSRPQLPWHCEMVIDWIDLGQNYFPRYLRSAKCTSNRCFYHHYNCKPKAFTVKVLRRITDKCIEITDAAKENFEFPFDILDSDEPQFREPWAFEEKAVNFCCECAP